MLPIQISNFVIKMMSYKDLTKGTCADLELRKALKMNYS